MQKDEKQIKFGMRTNNLTHNSLHHLVKVKPTFGTTTITDFNKTFKINPKTWNKKENVQLPSINRSQSVM